MAGRLGFPSEAEQVRERARECARLTPQERADIMLELLDLEAERLRSSPDPARKLRHLQEQEDRAREAYMALIHRQRAGGH